VVGGGPAGIEMAATLGDLLPQWADRFEGLRSQLRIVVVNRGQDILKGDINDGLRETAREALQQRLVPVEVLTKASAAQVRSDALVYEQNGERQEIPTATVIWTAGNRVNPIVQNLEVSAENQDKAGRLRVLPTLQLPDYPNVFAAGDCTVLSDPQPATAQVAYQQGAAIAKNLNALAQNQPPQPAQVNLRGTMMKLGLTEGAANLFNRVTIAGRTGHLIRQGTYLELLPNPVHNFKATLGWLTDEIFQRHGVLPSSYRRFPNWAAQAVVGMVVVVGGLFVWRSVAPSHFEKTWESTGIPELFDGSQNQQ
jgi:NADH dehydrogenase